jgi:dipeptide/tripeptide permease
MVPTVPKYELHTELHGFNINDQHLSFFNLVCQFFIHVNGELIMQYVALDCV